VGKPGVKPSRTGEHETVGVGRVRAPNVLAYSGLRYPMFVIRLFIWRPSVNWAAGSRYWTSSTATGPTRRWTPQPVLRWAL